MSANRSATCYWVVATRGLEQVVRAELVARVPDAGAIQVAYRRVGFSSAAEPRSLLGLRTPDDLFVDLAPWEQVDHRRTALSALGEQARALDLRDATTICREVRDLGAPPDFSVTVNFVGRRNYSTDEIKLAVSSGIEDSHGWNFQARDIDADLNVRVFIEHQRAYIGLRLARAPLHERPYKLVNIAGSLKPTVAAAMVQLGDFVPNALVVDPLCGAGTIPIEAGLLGLRAAGGDLAADALDAARANQAAAGVAVAFEHWDARAMPLASGEVDGVVCNLPWGRQVPVEANIEDVYAACIKEMARILRPGGRAVLLTNLQQLLRDSALAAGLQVEREVEISLSGQTPVITVLAGSK